MSKIQVRSMVQCFARYGSSLLRGIAVASLLSAALNAEEKSANHATTIAAVQTNLDAGKLNDAKTQLASTDESKRGFEFDYLQARLQQTTEGQAAPDLIRTIKVPEVETRYAILNPVTRQAVFICRDGSLRIHELSTPEGEARVVKHPLDAPVWNGSFSHDGNTFVSGHQNGDVLIWDATSWSIRQTVALGQDWPVRELAVSPDGLSIVAESKGGLELWSLADGAQKKIAMVGERYNFGEGLAFSPAGDMIATGGMFDILLHNATTGERIRAMRHASYTMGLEFSPDGKSIASAPRGNVNKFLAVFDVSQDQPKFNAGPFGHYVAGLAFSPDGTRIAATGCEKLVRLFDAATGETVLSVHREDCSSRPAFTHDGRLLGWSEPSGFLFIDLGKKPE